MKVQKESMQEKMLIFSLLHPKLDSQFDGFTIEGICRCQSLLTKRQRKIRRRGTPWEMVGETFRLFWVGGGKFTDFGLNLGVDDEKPPFLAVKVTFRVHLKY